MAWQVSIGLYWPNNITIYGQPASSVLYGTFPLTPWGDGRSYQFTGIIASDGIASIDPNNNALLSNPLEPGVASPIYNFGGNNYSGHSIDVLSLNLNQLPGHWVCGVQIARFWGAQKQCIASTGMQYVTSYLWLSPSVWYDGGLNTPEPSFIPYTWTGRTWDLVTTGLPVQRVFQTTWPWSAQKPLFSTVGSCLFSPWVRNDYFFDPPSSQWQWGTGITDDMVWTGCVWTHTQQPIDSTELINTGVGPVEPTSYGPNPYPSAYCGTQGVPCNSGSANVIIQPGEGVRQFTRRNVFDPRITQFFTVLDGYNDYLYQSDVLNTFAHGLLYTFHDFQDQKIEFGTIPSYWAFKWWYDSSLTPAIPVGIPGPYAIPLGLDYSLTYLGAKQV